jgi:hypothetical protein
MAGAWSTLTILDGGSPATARTMRVWDESGSGAGPFSFAQMASSGNDGGGEPALETGGNLATVATEATAIAGGVGTTADAAVSAGAAGSLSAKLRSISRDLVANIVLAAGANVIGAVTQSGSWVLAAGSALVGIFKLGDGTNTLTLLAGSSGSPAGTVVALPVSIRDANTNGRKIPANCAPVVNASQAYNTVAASETKQALTGGSGGATGDWLDFLLIVPATTSPGAVGLYDSSGGAEIIVFAGGSSSVASLVPFAIPIRAISAAGAWCVTTGANVSVVASGNFT